jgi:3D (Asp-Asp-Asp) domain-containing protein
VRPSLGSSVQAGMRVTIERSKPVLVSADGHTVRTRTRGKSIGDTLAELGITVAGSDRVTPAMPEAVTDDVAIRVVRVQDLVQVDRQPIPYELVVTAADELEIDHQQLTQAGAEGEFRRRYHIGIEDGVEVTRTLIDAWVAAQPITNVVSYGRKVVMRTLDTSEGQISYWRHIRMYATSYSKSTAGVSPSASYFGITRLGLTMRRGIVAVDPTVVILGSRLYVPGYGTGLAGDTGGGVRGKWLDLGYDDENLVAWHQWVDVYLLGNPPPPSLIRWVLPNWPQFK